MTFMNKCMQKENLKVEKEQTDGQLIIKPTLAETEGDTEMFPLKKTTAFKNGGSYG